MGLVRGNEITLSALLDLVKEEVWDFGVCGSGRGLAIAFPTGMLWMCRFFFWTVGDMESGVRFCRCTYAGIRTDTMSVVTLLSPRTKEVCLAKIQGLCVLPSDFSDFHIVLVQTFSVNPVQNEVILQFKVDGQSV